MRLPNVINALSHRAAKAFSIDVRWPMPRIPSCAYHSEPALHGTWRISASLISSARLSPADLLPEASRLVP